MFCRKCGNKLLDDDAFCNKCGAKVIVDEASQENVDDKDINKETSASESTQKTKRNDILKKEDAFQCIALKTGKYIGKAIIYFLVYVVLTAIISWLEVPSDMFKRFLTDPRGLWSVCFQYMGEAIVYETFAIPILVWLTMKKNRLFIFELLFVLAIIIHALKFLFTPNHIDGLYNLILWTLIFIIGIGLLLFDKRLDTKVSTLKKVLYAVIPFSIIFGAQFYSFLSVTDSFEEKERENTHTSTDSQSTEVNHEPGVFIKLGDPKDGIIVHMGDSQSEKDQKIGIVLELNPNKKDVIHDGKLTTQAEKRILEIVLSVLKSANIREFDADNQAELKYKIKYQINQALGDESVYDVYITSFQIQ